MLALCTARINYYRLQNARSLICPGAAQVGILYDNECGITLTILIDLLYE